MNNTKEQLSDALEELIAEKPLSKITVGQVASQCGVSRMTFYYHFKDLFELVKWTFVRRAEEGVAGIGDTRTWKQGLHKMFQLMVKNKVLVINVYESIGHDRLYAAASEILKEYAHDDFSRACSELSISDEDKDFVSDFYTNAVVGICFGWIADSMEESEIDGLVEKCQTALSASARHMLEAFAS